MENQDLPPLVLLREYSRDLPRAWRQLADMRERRGKDLPWWPDWCYVPIAGAIAVVTEGAPLPLGPAEKAKMLAHPPAIVAALAAWRMTKGIYRFDPTLLEEVANMPLDGNLPAQVFLSLPEWCVYIETPGLVFRAVRHDISRVDGFFAHLEYDVNHNRSELRLVLYMPDAGAQGFTPWLPFPVHLGEWSVEEAVRRTFRAAQVDVWPLTPDEEGETVAGMAAAITPFINLVLYICSANADFGDERPTHPSQRPPADKKKKLVAAEQPRIWDVGIRLGPALRRAQTTTSSSPTATERSQTSRASPRPHWRRGHWHHYWTGPRSKPEERKLIVHWLPPIPVGIPEFDAPTPAVIRKIVRPINQKKED